MRLKILSLNVARYDGSWEERMEKIVALIRREQPDLVFLQEVFDDDRHNTPLHHQARQLNEVLEFRHCIYDIVEMVTTEHQKPVLVPVFDGLACLTNLDIVDNGLRYLVRATDDRHYRAIQTITIEHEGECVTFFHVHFSNRTDWAREHVRETITVAAEQPELPIILGDLNVLDIQGMADLYSPRYHTSYDVEPYISFPSKDEVLDYVLLPHGMTFTSVQCTEDVLSDHRPLLVEIDTAAATASLV